MSKKMSAFPHVISFRLSNEMFGILERQTGAEVSVHDYCRNVVLDKLTNKQNDDLLTKLIFQEVARLRYLIANAFTVNLEGAPKVTHNQWETIKKEATERGHDLASSLLKMHLTGKAVAERPEGMQATAERYGPVVKSPPAGKKKEVEDD